MAEQVVQSLEEGGQEYAQWSTSARVTEMQGFADLGVDLAAAAAPGTRQSDIDAGSTSAAGSGSGAGSGSTRAANAMIGDAAAVDDDCEEAPIFDFSKEEVEKLVAEGAFMPRPLGGIGVCERYALLGDRVLNLYIVEALMGREPGNSLHEKPEAWMKRMSAIYQAPSIMVGLADELNLTSMIRMILGKDDVVLGQMVKVFIIKAMIGSTFRVKGQTAARNTARNIMKYVDAELMKRQAAAMAGPVTATLAAGQTVEIGEGVSATGVGGGAVKIESDVHATSFGIRVRPASAILKEWFFRRNLPQPVITAKYVAGPAHKPEFVGVIEYVVCEQQQHGGIDGRGYGRGRGYGAGAGAGIGAGFRQKYVSIGQETLQSARRSSKKAAMEAAAIGLCQALDIPPEKYAEAALLDCQMEEQMHEPGEHELRKRRRVVNGVEVDELGNPMPIQQWVFQEPTE